jgi:hypothetical protein
MFLRLILAVSILLLSACSAMQPAASEPALVQAAEKLRLLMIDPDRAQLEAIVSNDLTYGHSGGKIDTKASFIADLLSGASDFVTIDITDQQVRVSGDVAWVRHTLSAKTNDGGKPGQVTIRILQVWHVEAGQWKLLARQAIRPPA